MAGIIDKAAGFTYSDLTIGGGWLATIAWIVFLVPNLAVSVRRLHDTGRSGWWLLIGLVPLIGWIVLLYFFILEARTTTSTARTRRAERVVRSPGVVAPGLRRVYCCG